MLIEIYFFVKSSKIMKGNIYSIQDRRSVMNNDSYNREAK